MPNAVTFGAGQRTLSYGYDANGEKHSVTHTSSSGTSVTEYCDNVIYRNGSPAILLTEIGYYSFADGRYHTYIRDWQGNNRVVLRDDGLVEELNDYYASGCRIGGADKGVQPYKYSGKELDTFGDLNWYDFGARHYDPVLMRWTTTDPLSEKYYGVSPYAFCNNNPVNFVDPDGELPFLANFVGGFVSAGVEYGSQVIGNIFSDGFSVESFTNVDVFDIGVAFGEGFITSGTNVARKVITKAAVELTGEIARNAVDVKIGYGTDHTPIVNSFGDVIVDTAIGVASEAIHIDVNISPFKGVSGTKAVRAAREAADESLSPQVADGVRRQNAMLNAEKAAANQAISEGVGSVLGSVASKVIDEIQDKYRD